MVAPVPQKPEVQMEQVPDSTLDLVPLLSSPVQNQLTLDNTPPVKTPKGPKTFGWRAHNELTYRGVDWGLNSAIGVATAYCTEKTAFGKKWMGDKVTGFYDTILKPIIKDEKARNNSAKWGNMFTSIIVGGTLIIPVMMALENKKNKKAIVRGLDEMRHGKDTVENDPKFKECYDNIDKEPEKKFSTGMGARLLVLAPLLVLTLDKKSGPWMKENVYRHIGNVTEWMAHKVGIKGERLKAKITMVPDPKDATKMIAESNWRFLHNTIGFDFGLTFLYSFMHEVAYKTLAAIKGKPATVSGDKTEDTHHAPVAASYDEPVVSKFAEKVGKTANLMSETPKDSHLEKLMDPAKSLAPMQVGA